MIVSCESCKSRYKLDDSKVTGRGAKITCPKCKHIFVVFAPVAEAPRASPNLASRAADDDDDEGPTRIGGPVGRPGGAPVNSISFGDGGGAPMAASLPVGRSNPTLAVPLPDMRAPESHVVGPSAYAPPPPPPPVTTVSPSDAPGRAAGLDFRKVGVTTWKVKVRIGLIYDFSDIKTLRKYITDGRVTPADVISHDGKAWKPIGEIPDLDGFFIDTYERLMQERGSAPAPAPKMPEPRVAEPPPSDARAEPEPSLYRDPFDDLRSRQRDRATRKTGTTSAAPAPSGARRTTPILLVALAVTLIGGGLWYVSGGMGTGAAPAAPPSVKAEAAKTIRDQEREDIQKKLKQQFSEVPTDPRGEPDGTVVFDPLATDPGVKVLDDGRVVRVKTPNGGSTPASSTSRPTPSVSASPTSPIKTTDASATDYEAIGDGAAKSKDWKGAARGYQDAVNLDPGNGRLLRKLGEAQYRAGQLDAAQGSLQAAADKGQKDALKLLGNIAREQGDVSQANAMYQQYLATGPKDATDVERILKEMNGG